jgi:hypothetical protein
VIGFAREQRARLEFGDVGVRAGQFAIEVFQQVFALRRIGLFLRQIDVRLDVANQRIELGFRGNLIFGTLPFAQDALSLLLVTPEVRLRDLFFEAL